MAKKTTETGTWETIWTFVTDHKWWFICGAVAVIAIWALS